MENRDFAVFVYEKQWVIKIFHNGSGIIQVNPDLKKL